MCGVSRVPSPHSVFPDRKRKRFLAFARNDNMGKGGILVSPSFLWKQVPRRGGDWLPLRTKRHVRGFPCPLSSQRLPDRERKRFLAFARNDNMGKAAFSYLPPSYGSRCPEGAEVGSRYALKGMCGASRFPHSSPLLPDRKRKRFLAFARNDNMGENGILVSPSFLWKEVPRRGRRLAPATH